MFEIGCFSQDAQQGNFLDAAHNSIVDCSLLYKKTCTTKNMFDRRIVTPSQIEK